MLGVGGFGWPKTNRPDIKGHLKKGRRDWKKWDGRDGTGRDGTGWDGTGNGRTVCALPPSPSGTDPVLDAEPETKRSRCIASLR